MAKTRAQKTTDKSPARNLWDKKTMPRYGQGNRGMVRTRSQKTTDKPENKLAYFPIQTRQTDTVSTDTTVVIRITRETMAASRR
jgi:hypothetical protein